MKRVLQVIFFGSLTALPALPTYMSHRLWEPTNDVFYYYARINEFLKGFWQIGNPYYYEHRNDIAVSFLVPDWLSAIPGSFIIWPLITALLIFKILKTLQINGKHLYLGTFFCFVTSLYSIMRTTSMQTIFPFFLIFFWSLILYLKSRKYLIFFIISSAITFYIYPYLWQVVVVALSLLVLRRKGSFWFIAIPVLALPALIYLYMQITSPFYFETMERIGLVYTRVPTLDTSVYFLVMSLPIFFLRKKLEFVVVYIAFTAILFSSVITGRELEISNHIVRFIALFGAIGITYLVSRSYKFLVLGIFWLVFFYNNYSLINQIFSSPKLPKILITEEMRKASVIKNKGVENNYLPFLSNSYVLFHPNGLLHLMSTDESLERYLVWRYPDKLTIADLLKDYRSFAGTGPAVHVIGHHNYHVRICNFLRLGKCGEIKDLYSYYGEKYFQKILDRYYFDISPNIGRYYQKYHVDYVSQ